MYLKHEASMNLIKIALEAYPAVTYMLNDYMKNVGLRVDLVADYDLSVDVIFFLMQWDVTCIVGAFKTEPSSRC